MIVDFFKHSIRVEEENTNKNLNSRFLSFGSITNKFEKKINSIDNYNFYYLVFFLIFICGPFLFFQTGIHGDDYTTISFFQNKNLNSFLFVKPESQGTWMFVLPAYYFFYILYFIIGNENLFIYDIAKYLIHVLSIYFVFKFFLNYFSKESSLFASLFFILSVSHDATTYWYMVAAYMIFFPSLILYSFHLIKNNSIYFGSFLLFISSFCYSSPPYIFGLSIIFLLEKSLKKFFLFFIIGLFFIIYYFIMSWYFPFIESKINNDINTVFFIKSFLLQLLSSIDSVIGLSFFLKVYYSIKSVNITSLLLSIILFFLFWINSKFDKQKKNYIPLLSGLIIVYFLSLCMFALTGMYAQSSFNLGNRVTIYPSLLIAYLLFLPKYNKLTISIFFLILVIPTFGLSTHWKEWNSHQNKIIHNINHNQNLKNLNRDDILIIKENTYSSLGLFSHIELFSMDWNVNNWFAKYVDSKNVMALTDYIDFENNAIVDPKSFKKISLNNKIHIYDTNKNKLYQTSSVELEKLIMKDNKEIRHWLQLIKKDNIIAKLVLFLSPRLAYLF